MPKKNNVVDSENNPPVQLQRVKTAELCGLVFPVSRFYKRMKKSRLADKIDRRSAVAVTSTLEYLVADMLEATAQYIKPATSGFKILRPADIGYAIQRDDELRRALGPNIIINQGKTVGQMFEENLMATQSDNKGLLGQLRDLEAEEVEEASVSEDSEFN